MNKAASTIEQGLVARESSKVLSGARESQATMTRTSVHKVEADGVSVFYRAAGDTNAPAHFLAARFSFVRVHVSRAYHTSHL